MFLKKQSPLKLLNLKDPSYHSNDTILYKLTSTTYTWKLKTDTSQANFRSCSHTSQLLNSLQKLIQFKIVDQFLFRNDIVIFHRWKDNPDNKAVAIPHNTGNGAEMSRFEIICDSKILNISIYWNMKAKALWAGNLPRVLGQEMNSIIHDLKYMPINYLYNLRPLIRLTYQKLWNFWKTVHRLSP